MSAAICLTPEQRREYISRYVALAPPAQPTLTRAARRWRNRPRKPPRALKCDEIIAWVLAWPDCTDAELAERIGYERSYVAFVRRSLGIPSSFSQRNDSRRAEMFALREAGWSFREIGERMGVNKGTVVGVLWRARRQHTND